MPSSVAEKINELSWLAFDASDLRKAEACFYLAARLSPFYREYAKAEGDPNAAQYLRNHVLLLWSQHQIGATPSRESAAVLEKHMPESSSPLSLYAQNAVVCALHLNWFLINRNDDNVRGCVVNYFDHIDDFVQERSQIEIGVVQFTDLIVERSRLFQREVAEFRQLLESDDGRPSITRRTISDCTDRDISGLIGR